MCYIRSCSLALGKFVYLRIFYCIHINCGNFLLFNLSSYLNCSLKIKINLVLHEYKSNLYEKFSRFVQSRPTELWLCCADITHSLLSCQLASRMCTVHMARKASGDYARWWMRITLNRYAERLRTFKCIWQSSKQVLHSFWINQRLYAFGRIPKRPRGTFRI